MKSLFILSLTVVLVVVVFQTCSVRANEQALNDCAMSIALPCAGPIMQEYGFGSLNPDQVLEKMRQLKLAGNCGLVQSAQSCVKSSLKSSTACAALGPELDEVIEFISGEQETTKYLCDDESETFSKVYDCLLTEDNYMGAFMAFAVCVGEGDKPDNTPCDRVKLAGNCFKSTMVTVCGNENGVNNLEKKAETLMQKWIAPLSKIDELQCASKKMRTIHDLITRLKF